MEKRSKGNRARGRWLTAAVCATVLTAGASATVAQTDPDELARRHFESGAAYFEEADYENALKAFDKAYELSKRPAILLNLATVHERMGNLAESVAALERYVELEPDSEGVETIRRRIENLRKRIGAAPAAEDAGPPETDAGPPPAPSATAAPDAGAASPPPSPPPSPPVAEEEPIDVPAYVLLSVGGLSAVGAVVTGLLANGEHSDLEKRCSPNCTDDDVSTGKTMALTSTILTGAAVVGVGVGAALLITGGSEDGPVQASPRPAVRVGLAPTGAAAEAVWRF